MQLLKQCFVKKMMNYHYFWIHWSVKFLWNHVNRSKILLAHHHLIKINQIIKRNYLYHNLILDLAYKKKSHFHQILR